MWRTGLVAPRHVGSSRTRAQTHVPCIGRRTFNHCATREALTHVLREEADEVRAREEEVEIKRCRNEGNLKIYILSIREI